MSKYGPNVTKLIFKLVILEAVPPGGGPADVIEFFSNPDRRKLVLSKAEATTLNILRIFKTAPDNPYGDDDEAIAGMLLKKIEEKRSQIFTPRRI
jgi:hypothetical protein